MRKSFMYMPELNTKNTLIIQILYLISTDSNVTDINGVRLYLMLGPNALLLSRRSKTD